MITIETSVLIEELKSCKGNNAYHFLKLSKEYKKKKDCFNNEIFNYLKPYQDTLLDEIKNNYGIRGLPEITIDATGFNNCQQLALNSLVIANKIDINSSINKDWGQNIIQNFDKYQYYTSLLQNPLSDNIHFTNENIWHKVTNHGQSSELVQDYKKFFFCLVKEYF